MAPTSFEVSVGAGDTVRALLYPASGSTSLQTAVILGHGAGGPQLSPFMTHFARGLAGRGADVVTFNFVYMERGRRMPDPAAKLEACYRAVIDTTRVQVPTARTRLVVGGKSMGGRIASQVVAADPDARGVAGLVFLGYPLYPPGRPERMRDAHLPAIRVPMLFVQGSRDPFGTPDELQTVLTRCRDARLHLVDGGGHSLKRKGQGAPGTNELYEAIQAEIAMWIATTPIPSG